MRDLEPSAPFTVFIRKLAFLTTTFTAPVNPTRVEDGSMRASHHKVRLSVLHDVAHRLARPNAVVAGWRASQHFPNTKIGHVCAPDRSTRSADD